MQSKVALITGAARRVGAAIAQVLHEAGMNIVIHFNTSKREAEQLCQDLNAKRANSAIAVQADLSDIKMLPALIDEIIIRWGRLDVLVNNASRFYKTHLGEVTETEWDDLFTSNLKAPFFLAQIATPYLKTSQGCIINITDIHGQSPIREYPVYCASKAGLIMLTKALAKELGPSIRVNAISPGAVAWPEGENTLSNDLKEKIMHSSALQKAGTADDIAKAVLFFVRDAGYVTGQVLAVDGGRSI